MNDTVCIVFTKSPIPGLVKTRLAGVLGVRGAAMLAQRMLSHTLAQAQACGLGPVALYGSPHAHNEKLVQAARFAGATRHAQRGADLGARMSAALYHILASSERALLFGTDAPALDAAMLRAADVCLRREGCDFVFVPTRDGGFVLVGCTRAVRAQVGAVFAQQIWSTASVMDGMRARLRTLGLRWQELPTVTDIDSPGDLIYAPRAWLEGPP
ncbi:MAG: TIGR04282 family arsenosugar biosynthesis glycosyltransferase [Acidiferrobacter sp.]